VFSVNVGGPSRQCLAGRFETARHWDNLRILDQPFQHIVRRASLRDRNLYTGLVDLHKWGTECEMVSARVIAGSEANVPVIAREANHWCARDCRRVELDWHAEMHSERVGRTLFGRCKDGPHPHYPCSPWIQFDSGSS